MHNRRFLFISIIIVSLAAVLVIAFIDRQKAHDAIRIGSVLILSGTYSSYGEQFRDGATIAVTELNRDKDKRPIEVIFNDSQGSKSKAKELVQVLYDRDGIRYLADIMGTGLLLESANAFNERKMIVLSGVNTGPELSRAGGRYFFRIIPSDAVAAEQLASWAIELGLTKAVVVHDVDDWGKGLAAEIREAYRGDALQVIDDIDCQSGLQLIGPVVNRIAAAKPLVVFLLVYPREAGLILRESRRQGLVTQFMGTDNFTGTELLEHANGAAEGVLFVLPGEEKQIPTSARSILNARYQELRNARLEPPLFTVMGYDVLRILADLARQFGDDTEAAANYLHSAQYEGASGHIRFKENGDVVVTAYRRMVFRRILKGGELQAISVPTSDRK